MKGRKPNMRTRPAASGTKRCPDAPAWLAVEAKAEWRRVAPEMHKRGILTQEARSTLASYCVAAGQVRECEKIMKAEGRVVKSETGPKTHPAWRIQQGAMREARLLAAELALTPQRHKPAEADGDDSGSGGGGGSNGRWDPDLLA